MGFQLMDPKVCGIDMEPAMPLLKMLEGTSKHFFERADLIGSIAKRLGYDECKTIVTYTAELPLSVSYSVMKGQHGYGYLVMTNTGSFTHRYLRDRDEAQYNYFLCRDKAKFADQAMVV